MHTIWDIHFNGQPKYLAIAECIEHGITNRHLKSGEKLPPHRKLADQLGVTVSTVSRAYNVAEKRGLITSRVGSGSFVMPARQNWHYARRQDSTPLINLSQSAPMRLQLDDQIAQTLQRLSMDSTRISLLLDYQAEDGTLPYRQITSDWLSQYGHHFDPARMILTLGGQHAIYCALQCLAQSEEHIAAAGLTYPGFINAARSLYLRVHPVELDDQGLIPSQLDALCRQYRIKAVYLTPNEHNPTTAQMGLQRRHELIELAQTYGFTIIEDDVNLFDGETTPAAMVSMAPNNVIYLSSLSKILAGGLRAGFMQAPARLYQRLVEGITAQCWMVPPLMSELSSDILASGLADEHVKAMRAELRARHQLADTVFAGIPHHRQPQGYFIWLPLPDYWRAHAFVEACARQNVGIYNSEIFALGNYPAPQAVRICLTGASSLEDLHTGLSTIKRIYNDASLSSRSGM